VAAKHGTLGLVRSLALELGPAGIRVVAIAPAATDTPGYRAAPARFSGPDAEQARRLLDDTIAKMALGRLAQADDIARAVVFAASDMAGFITGSTIHVDGGVDAS
jgi:NAD(P)-dependent dehydrogenase (short-subunit alcohol dehydrogenase family)